jgi:hypothetical protein
MGYYGMTRLSREQSERIAKVRKQRNLVVGGLLIAFVVLVFFISIAKMS